MNRRTNISDFTARVTGNYAHQLSCKPFYGLYEDCQNWSISAALKDSDTQYRITCYCKASYRWFLHKDKDETIMISPEKNPCLLLLVMAYSRLSGEWSFIHLWKKRVPDLVILSFPAIHLLMAISVSAFLQCLHFLQSTEFRLNAVMMR